MRKKAVVFSMVLLSLLAFESLAHGGLSDGLVAYWPFSGNARDASENGNHGTVVGAALCPDQCGIPNRAYRFDGVDDYIDIGSNVKPAFPFTVAAWVRVKDLGTSEGTIFINDLYNPAGQGYYGAMVETYGGYISGAYGDGGYAGPGSRQHRTTNEPVLAPGEWQHIAVRFNGHLDMDIYVNAEKKDGTWNGEGDTMQYSSNPGAIGVRIGAGKVPLWFEGSISEVRVYNRSLSEAEIKLLAQPGCNKPPVVHSFSANPLAGAPPLEVKFNCTASDPDGTIVQYRWDFDGDGAVDSTTEAPTATHTYSSLGQFDATVRVVDNLGATTHSDPVTINVAYGPDLTGKVEEFHFNQLLNRINVKFRAENAGTLASGDFKVSFYLSNDGINPILPPFKEVAVSGGLAPGANTLLSVAKTFPGSIYGKYVLIRVDKLNEVAEINETNNGARAVVQFAKAPVPVYTNGSMKCSITADPLAGAPPLQVKFTASASEPGHAITKYRWDFDGDGTIDSTTAGRTTQHTYGDLGSFNARVTAVSSSGRTCRAGPMKIYVAYGPDLTGKAEEFHFYELLKKVAVKFRAQNAGTVAAGGFKVSFYLSNDGITPILPAFKEFTVPGLAPGANTLLTVSETFPSSIYGKYVLIQIDDGNQVAEINETNNAARMVVRNMKTD